MFKNLIKKIEIYKSKKKIRKKAKVIGKNIVINDKVKINSNTYFGNNIGINGLTIRDNGEVRFGDNISIAKGCLILTGNHDYKNGLPYGVRTINKNVIIGDNVWIGQNVTILGGVTIGEGAVIQAGSVVAYSIPNLAVAGGNPCNPFKYRDKKDYEELKKNNKIYKFGSKKSNIL